MDYTCGRASVIHFHIDLSVHNIPMVITNFISLDMHSDLVVIFLPKLKNN